MPLSPTKAVSLHVHSEFSTPDGVAHVSDIARLAAEDGAPAIALTDHGTCAGFASLSAAAAKHSIKPIYGVELYVSSSGVPYPNDDNKKPPNYYHLSVWAATQSGFANLLQLQLAASQHPTRGRPVAAWDELAARSDGLIVATGCLSGPVKSRLARGDSAGADAELSRLVEVFGAENLYAEVMSHGIMLEDRMADELVRLADSHGIALLATNDSHCSLATDEPAHHAKMKANHFDLDDGSTGYWLRTAAEMSETLSSWPRFSEGISNTLEVAGRIEPGVGPLTPTDDNPYYLPRFDAARTSDELLRRLAVSGLACRYPATTETAKERLDYELSVIAERRFSDYFLVLADGVQHIRQTPNSVGPGRGSAGGSLVAYVLSITDVDPIRYGLLFERFLSPTRQGMPDIDIDMTPAARTELLRYLGERYGTDKLARVAVSKSWGGRSAILAGGIAAGYGAPSKTFAARDAARKLANLVPAGDDTSITEMLSGDSKHHAALRAAVTDATTPHAVSIAAAAASLDGVIHELASHPCAVVLADRPLNDVVPLVYHPDVAAQAMDGYDPALDDIPMVELDGEEVERAGLLKFDALKSVYAELIQRCCIRAGSDGTPLDLTSVDGDDTEDPMVSAAWDLIGRGATSTIYQLENSQMTQTAVRVQPRSIPDLAAVLALVRPGPMREGLHSLFADRRAAGGAVDYKRYGDTPDELAAIATVLDETLGVPVYQEQLMFLGEIVAGFTPMWRDKLRHAVAKKVPEEMAEVGERFIARAGLSETLAGAPKQVFSKETAQKVWKDIVGAGGYAFNKSHSVAYAKVAFIGAYLKANYPAAYYAARLATFSGGGAKSTRRAALFAAAKDEGFRIFLPPDVQTSSAESTLSLGGKSVIGGLAEVDGVGDSAVVKLLTKRAEAGGSFADFSSFLAAATTAPKVPVGVLEHLIEAGALDAFNLPRRAMFDAIRRPAKERKSPLVADEWDPLERAQREFSRLKLYADGHPLKFVATGVKAWLKRNHLKAVTTKSARIYGSGDWIQVIGLYQPLSGYRPKGNQPKIRFSISGAAGTLSCLVWASSADDVAHTLAGATPGYPLFVAGKVKAGWAPPPASDNGEEDEDEDAPAAPPAPSVPPEIHVRSARIVNLTEEEL